MLTTKARGLGLALSLCILLSGCTARDLYRFGQERQREQCRDGPVSEFDECMERANESFESYQQKKKEVEEDQ